ESFPSDGALYAAALMLPYSTTGQRWSIRDELVSAYNPACQSGTDRSSIRELARRIDAVEFRQQEQSSQVLLLLTNLNKMFAPQPVDPRRPIGFLPATEAGNSQ